jgi:WD40 repeat protein
LLSRAEVGSLGDPHSLCAARGLFVGGGDTGEVVISDLASNRLGLKFEAHAGPVLAVAISPDGKHLATLGAENKVKVWSLE